MSGRELYKIMIKNDLDFVIDKIIEKNNDLTIKELKIEELEQKVEQLESIRKETIEYIKDWQSYPHTKCTTHNELKNLLNILNKGSDKE